MSNISHYNNDCMDRKVISALYQRMGSRNDRLRMSNKTFEELFYIDPNFYLYEYGTMIEELINKSHNTLEVGDYDCLAVWSFVQCLQTLLLTRVHENSTENEFTKIYSFMNIINVNRSCLERKMHYCDRLFRSFLFCAPYSWEFGRHFKLTTKGITYKRTNIEKTVFKLLDIADTAHEADCLEPIGKILKTVFFYLSGKKLSLPYYPQKDIYTYYFFHPYDFVELFHNEKKQFYQYLDGCVEGQLTFMKKAFVFNYNLFALTNQNVMPEFESYSTQREKVKSVLWATNVTLPNSIIKEAKCGIEDRYKSRNTAT